MLKFACYRPNKRSLVTEPCSMTYDSSMHACMVRNKNSACEQARKIYSIVRSLQLAICILAKKSWEVVNSPMHPWDHAGNVIN